MPQEPKETKTLVDKMRANTEQGQRKVWAKPYRQSRKKYPKARHKKA